MVRGGIVLVTVADEAGWPARFRIACLYLFGALPLALLFSRTAAELIVAFIGLSFLAVVFQRRRWDILRAPLLAIPIGIWIFLMAVNTPLAVDPAGTLGRTVPWLRFFCLFGAAVFWLFADRRDFRIVALMWCATIAFVWIDGFVQGATGTSLTGQSLFEDVRITGPLDRPNIGMFTARLFLPALVAFALTRREPFGSGRLVLLSAMIVASTFFIVFTGERSATIVNFVALGVSALVLTMRSRRAGIWGLAGMAGMVAVIAGTVMSSDRLQTRIEPTLGVLRDFWSSEYGELVKVAFWQWRDHPITGVGIGNFEQMCGQWGSRLAHPCVAHPHNIYMEWLAEAGVPGLAGILVFICIVLVLVLRAARHRRDRPFTGALLAGAPMLTVFPFVATQSFFTNWPAMVWWSSLSLTAAAACYMLHRQERES